MRTTYVRPDDLNCCGLVRVDDEPQLLEEAYDHEPIDRRAPELSLLMALLERTILDLGGQVQRIPPKDAYYEPIHDAFAWVTDVSSDEPWSFVWVCEQLHLHPMWTQRRVFQLAENLVALHERGTHDIRSVWKDAYARTH